MFEIGYVFQELYKVQKFEDTIMLQIQESWYWEIEKISHFDVEAHLNFNLWWICEPQFQPIGLKHTQKKS